MLNIGVEADYWDKANGDDDNDDDDDDDGFDVDDDDDVDDGNETDPHAISKIHLLSNTFQHQLYSNNHE